MTFFIFYHLRSKCSDFWFLGLRSMGRPSCSTVYLHECWIRILDGQPIIEFKQINAVALIYRFTVISSWPLRSSSALIYSYTLLPTSMVSSVMAWLMCCATWQSGIYIYIARLLPLRSVSLVEYSNEERLLHWPIRLYFHLFLCLFIFECSAWHTLSRHSNVCGLFYSLSRSSSHTQGHFEWRQMDKEGH